MDNKIKIDNSNFYNLPNWEMEEILSTTHLNFFWSYPSTTSNRHPKTQSTPSFRRLCASY